MPYKEESKWRAKVIFERRRYTRLFQTKSEAVSWESRLKRKLKEKKIVKKPNVSMDTYLPPSSFEEFKKKYQKLYQNPFNTVADIFDAIAEEMELPFRYKDILNVAIGFKKKKNQRISAGMRMQVLERDDFTCKLCGVKNEKTPKLHVDHIMPKSKGGITELRNLQTLCQDCNLGKNNKKFYLRS